MSEEVKTVEQIAIRRGAERPRLLDLVDALVKESGKEQDLVIRDLMKLLNEKKLIIEEGKPYSDLVSYAFSPLSLWFWGAIGAVGLSVALIWVTSGVALYLRYAFGSTLALFLPGYALVQAFYPKMRQIDELTRFALSIGLSLALVPLVGLVLNYTPFGIRLLPVTSSIAGVTVLFLGLALFRKHQYYKLAKGTGKRLQS